MNDLTELFKLADEDGSGGISFAEFLLLMRNLMDQDFLKNYFAFCELEEIRRWIMVIY